MKVSVSAVRPFDFKTELLVVGMFKGQYEGQLKVMDRLLDGTVRALIKSKVFEGEKKQTYLIHTLGKLMAERLLLVGLGEEKKFGLEALRRAAAMGAKSAKGLGVKNYSTDLQSFPIKNTDASERAQAVVEGSLLGLYEYNRQTKDKKKEIRSLTLLDKKNAAKCQKGAKLGEVISDAVIKSRDIVNAPGSDMTPSRMAAEAKRIGKDNKIKVKVLGKKELKKMGMNSIIGVSRGSKHDPALIIMDYNPKAKDSIAIVGKGITFDAGGLNLKPTSAIQDMKSDKGGAAVVLGVMDLVAKLRIPLHVIGVIPASENMPGGDAQKPGDIVRAYNGKTIEIVNTDAEGRLILADALSYVEKKYKPKTIIDIATLTGAVTIALGYYAAGMVGTSEKLMKLIERAGESTGERVWKLPFWDDYRELVKGDIADVNNSTKGSGYGPGTINGGSFLSNFVEKTPWVHLDIAATAWWPSPGAYVPKGGTGWGVRLLTKLLMDWKKS